MRLRKLIRDIEGARLQGADVDIRSVRDDSRLVEPGDLFVAVRGLTVDGHEFVRAAVDRGAAGVVIEGDRAPAFAAQLDGATPAGTAPSLVIVPNGSVALGWLAAAAAGRPSDRMTMIGVTGTNGKTTTTFLIESILAAAAARPGVIGTVSYRYGGKETPAPFTTPMPLALHELLGEMAGAGCTHVVMEASSAALAMHRLEGTRFQAAAFSNLTQDHLEVHGTMEAYFEAKALLYSRLLALDGVAAAMIDDPRGAEILARAPAGARRIGVSVRGAIGVGVGADVSVVRAESSISGIRATLRTPRGEIDVASAALLGEYNLANMALATAVAEGLGVSHEAIARGIGALPGVPGRVERVANASGLDVFVDYAHTPDALERVIAALRPLTRGRLIVVFGCGGDRDRTKRPKMGHIVARDADVAVVTSDNPRTEDPRSIIAMILDGVREIGRPHLVEADRRRAIGMAVAEARAGDVVLIAGKGHEDYQILGKSKIHFDDREEAAAAITKSAAKLAQGPGRG